MGIYKIHKAWIFCFVLLTVLPFSVFAFDAGVLIDQDLSLESPSDNLATYTASLIPWLSAPVGDNGDFYLSLGIAVNNENNKWKFIPELLRTDISYRFGKGEITAGRMKYSDPLNFIASGFFDGMNVTLDTSAGSFGAGLWYTGLFYKKTINITMTEEDLVSYAKVLAHDDVVDTYFSSRRLLAALDWEHPGLWELVRLRVALLNQADLNRKSDWYHSQYLVAQASVPVKDIFVFDLGGSLSFAETAKDVSPSLAGELGLAIFLPTVYQDRLRVSGIFSSGKSGSISPFVPVTTVTQGEIPAAKLSGLSLINLDYIIRFHQAFSARVTSSYFVLSDLATYQGWPAGKDGHFLGNEFFLRMIWSPVSDFQFNFGAGVFVPAMGNADPEEKPGWKIEFNAKLAVF